ncbi:MAG: sigma-54 dependent transcriptional regulator [Acidobacteriota bacterium]
MTPGSLPGFVAQAEKSRRLAELAGRAAARANTVLIRGETGTGKGFVSRAMHRLGLGEDAPYTVIDCGNLPEGLAESELFGHEPGAFSGAEGRKPGRFEIAAGGTVLLDRVEDLPYPVQGKLLRVLQERTFERVGGRQTLHVKARVHATSSADLTALVADGNFREDLFYRLDVVTLEVPPLRDRLADLPDLVTRILDETGASTGKHCRVDPKALAYLGQQNWPGNLRQLRNCLERAVVLSEEEVIGKAQVEACLTTAALSPEKAIADLAELGLSLEEIERLYIERVLTVQGNAIGRSAKVLGIHRKTLLDKRKRYGLS